MAVELAAYQAAEGTKLAVGRAPRRGRLASLAATFARQSSNAAKIEAEKLAAGAGAAGAVGGAAAATAGVESGAT